MYLSVFPSSPFPFLDFPPVRRIFFSHSELYLHTQIFPEPTQYAANCPLLGAISIMAFFF
jgi:hypothetical protein